MLKEENNTIISIIQPYNDLLHKIVNDGIETDSTLALFNQSIQFNVEDLNDELGTQLFIPYNRGRKKGALAYGIAEAIWYRRKTQDPSLISNFAKIWEHMKDPDGLIQSNYGYQLDTNNDLIQFNEELYKFIQHKHLDRMNKDLFIASQNNCMNEYDLVCNNKINIDIHKNEFTKEIAINAKIFARSIDVIYGLPYDLFTAHGYLAMIKEKLQEFSQHHYDINIKTITFNIVNVHWYLRDQPDDESLEQLSDKIITIHNNATPYSIYMSNFTINDLTVDDVKKQRELSKMHSMTTDAYTHQIEHYSKDFHYHYKIESVLFDQAKNSTIIKSIKKVAEIELNESLDVQDESRLDVIIERLRKNKFERKTLLVTKNNYFIYIMYNGSDYLVTCVK